MEYNEEQEKEYISRESLNRLCKEAQELRWYKRYRSGASKAWLASCYIGGCFAGIQMLKPWETANASFGRALLEYKRPLVWRWFLSSFLFCLHVFQQR